MFQGNEWKVYADAVFNFGEIKKYMEEPIIGCLCAK